MPTVYVCNKAPHDFSAAERYGPLVFMSEGLMSKYATNQIWRTLYPFLSKATDEDYLLVTGLTITNIIAVLVLAATGRKKVNLLLFKNNQGYVCRTIWLGEGHEEQESKLANH